MQREQFHALLARAAEVCGRKELVVFGSQSVHAVTPSPPVEVLISAERDIWFRDEPETVSRLSAELGKDSAFARAAGVYADPLPPDLPMVPAGWEKRLVTCQVADVTARCLEIHNLIVTKLSAGRLKDYEFIAAVLIARLAQKDEVIRRVQMFPDPHTQACCWRVCGSRPRPRTCNGERPHKLTTLTPDPLINTLL